MTKSRTERGRPLSRSPRMDFIHELRVRVAVVVPIKLAYFLHYMGITTNWKLAIVDRLQVGSPGEDLVEDRSVQKVLAPRRSST